MYIFPMGLTGRFPFVVTSGGRAFLCGKNPRPFHPPGPSDRFRQRIKRCYWSELSTEIWHQSPGWSRKKSRSCAPLFSKNARWFFLVVSLQGKWGAFPKFRGYIRDIPKNGWFIYDVWEVWQRVFFFGGGGNLWQEKNRSIFGPVMDKWQVSRVKELILIFWDNISFVFFWLQPIEGILYVFYHSKWRCWLILDFIFPHHQ